MLEVPSPVHLLTHLGPRWVAFRGWYALQRRAGLLVRRSPPCEWSGVPAPAENPAIASFWSAPPVPGPECIGEADAVLAGRFRMFSGPAVVAGFPPAWARNQLTGETVPTAPHWSRLGDFAFGDIKGVWELSRFGWAFVLARAYARSGEERYAEGFWRLFEDWCAHARPNCGPNWMCGQEATFRLMAVVFARSLCASARAATPARLELFRRFVHATGSRVEANLAYALSQSNNHGVSECVGLITAARVLPASSSAPRWSRLGWSGLERQVAALVYADGGFAQHSINYHRVLLHDLIWVVMLLRADGASVPDWLTTAGRRAVGFLAPLVDPATGSVPLFGSNDGALILPLADGGYPDFRPVLQAAAALFDPALRLPAGPWDEAALWAVGRQVLGSSISDTPEAGELRRYSPDAGFLFWRRGETRVLLRCPVRFRHRPAQADLLHVDVAWRGRPIAIDAGTFSYHDTGRFARALKEAAVHNSVTFDGLEPMTKAGRFLYLPWPHGDAGWDERKGEFYATHDGWRRHGLSHRRSVAFLESGELCVTDRLAVSGARSARVHWLLADHPYRLDAEAGRLVLATPAGALAVAWRVAGARVSVVRADPASNRGWWSPFYARVEPALSLAIEFPVAGEAVCTTSFAPDS